MLCPACVTEQVTLYANDLPARKATMPPQTNLPQIYFSDVFGVSPEAVDAYGAFDIALVTDLPLFVDPFLLFDSENEKYKSLHDEIIKYLVFLRDRALADEMTEANISHWLLFREVRQNWFGFSKTGNQGTGLGRSFAQSLAKNLKSVFSDFGNETLTSASHIEKLSLLSGGVGRDHLSDFTTNLIKSFLLSYTQDFAQKHLRPERLSRFHVDKVSFDYERRRWKSEYFILPYHQQDFVLLTPKEILTRDDAWINQSDLLNQFTQVRASIPDAELRAQVDEHFKSQISAHPKADERRAAALRTVEKYSEVLDYYIRGKEQDAPKAHIVSNQKVHETHRQFVENIKTLLRDHIAGSNFYELGDSYDECHRRVAFLKHVIEDNDGYRVFYVEGRPIKRESDLHTMFRLTWFATEFDVNSEVNNGRGPVDYKVSKGRENASLVEFKLASNSGLKRNLQHQVGVYAKANDTTKSIKVILYFSDSELLKVNNILKELGLMGQKDIVLIDGSLETKASGSKASN